MTHNHPPVDPAPAQTSGERWISVARLLRPQGRRGELLADPLTDLTGVFEASQTFRLARDETSLPAAPAITLEQSWRPQGRNASRLVVKLAGINSISAAEALADLHLFLPASALPTLAPDTYLVGDLVGCLVYNGESPVGTVTDLQFPIAADGRTRLTDAADLLVLHPEGAPADAEPVLIPFVRAWLEAVDLPAKRILMHLPPGLVGDLAESTERDPEEVPQTAAI